MERRNSLLRLRRLCEPWAMQDESTSQAEAWILCPKCRRRSTKFDLRCRSCGQKLPDQGSGPLEPDPAARPAAPSRTLSADAPLLGQRLANYRLVELLGRGGMGVVYRAEPLEGGRSVALKTVVLHDA